MSDSSRPHGLQPTRLISRSSHIAENGIPSFLVMAEQHSSKQWSWHPGAAALRPASAATRSPQHGGGALGWALAAAALVSLRLALAADVALSASHSVHLLLSSCIHTPVTSHQDPGLCIWITWKSGAGKHHSN